jgi:hypothetical protein
VSKEAREQTDKMREHTDHLREHTERMRERAEHQRQKAEHHRQEAEQRMREHLRQSSPPGAGVPPEQILSEAKPGGGGQIKVYNENSVTSWDGGKARLLLKDQDGEIEVAVDNGKRTLIAKNSKGETVFTGPVDTEEQRQAVPEQFRKKLDQLNIRQQTEPAPSHAEPRGADAGEEAPLLSRIPFIGQLFAKPAPPAVLVPSEVAAGNAGPFEPEGAEEDGVQ